ncbi:PAS domain-containing protein [Spirosoma soli]|uniref:PAS domain-containing protein n=1 Tax=Spirosoma soli TaxID=1770529 RepID=A0ABW5M0G9_9BACT
MNFTGPYDKQVADQYKTARITPLWSGWEFGHKSLLANSAAGWLALAREKQWQLPAPLRHNLISGEWAVVITDTAQVIQYVNSRFEQMSGYASHEVTGRSPSMLQGNNTDQLTRQRIKRALEQQKPVDERLLNYRKDQTPYWCNVSIRPIFNRQKELVNFIAFEQETVLEDQLVCR